MADPAPVAATTAAVAAAPLRLRIGFVGLGVMGAPIAGHLAAAGHQLSVYNRTPIKTEAWLAQHAGAAAASPVAAASGADVVLTCVGNDDDLAEVVLGDMGVFAAMSPGTLLIDHTTVSADLARRIAVVGAARGIGIVDAPVSGGEAGARQGALSIMCGATPEGFARAEVVMRPYAARIVHVGAAGSGQMTKMVNQIAIAGVVQGLSEALAFAEASGLDLDRVFDAISGGAAASWQMSNRWQSMAEGRFDFGFAVDWMRKDLGLALDEGRRAGASLPVAALVDQFYGEVQKMGGSRQDTSALVRRLR